MSRLNDFGSMSKERVESCLILSAPQTRRAPQFLSNSTGIWQWPKYKHKRAYCFIRLSETRATLHLGSQEIVLVGTIPNYGGVRWWWQCPQCDRRAARLYLPTGKDNFKCRLCYDLSYESAQNSRAKYYRLFKGYGISSRIIREDTRERYGGSLVADLVGVPTEF